MNVTTRAIPELAAALTPGVLMGDGVIELVGQRMLIRDMLPIVLDLHRCCGNYLWDSKSNRPLLDCFSFIASNPIGFAHPKLRDGAFEQELLATAKVKVSNSDLLTPELAKFVDTFARVAMPAEFKYLFFVEGVSVAVENALKAAFDWKVRLNFSKGCTEERGTKVIHFKEAFHGRTGYTLSLTNTDPKKTKYFPKFNWPRITNPKIRFPLDAHEAEVLALEAQALREIEDAFKEHGNDIAAIILEPIQGEGGDNHFRPEFHQALRQIADREEVLLIYDEVQSGVGLTGKMWAYQHYGIVPDIVAFGKKVQVCGIMAGSKLDRVRDNVFQESSRINSTWGGNLCDMARSRRYLEIIEQDRLVENAASVGETLVLALHDLAARSGGRVFNVRGKGLMCSFDLPSREQRDTLIQKNA